MHSDHWTRRLAMVGVLGSVCALAACGSSPAATAPAGTAAATHVPAPRTAASGTAKASRPARPVPVPQPAPRVTVTLVRAADGSVVTLATFSGPVRYVLHNGSQDPGPAASGVVRAGPVVAGAERKRLLAAFNGGFKLDAGVGGYEQETHVISRLRPGLASLVIDRSGRARIGVWGHGVPVPGEQVYSVRQNLRLLVQGGKLTPAAFSSGLWGATLGGSVHVARSAIGQNAVGDLIYAASMSAAPADLAVALVRAGARVAMELDINPEWVQLDVARRPGGSLRAGITGQDRPADQYLVGWSRDFFTVLAPTARSRA
jgi:hypothetical protein